MYLSHRLLLIALCGLICLTACQEKAPFFGLPLLPMANLDTIDLDEPLKSIEFGDSLDAELLISMANDSLLEEIYPDHQLAEYTDAVMGLYHFPLDDQHEAVALSYHYSWQYFRGLLIYDKSQKTYIKSVPFSYLEGGDGGQSIGKSWYIPAEKALVSHYVDQWLAIAGEETQQIRKDSLAFFQWDGEDFVYQTSSTDSTLVKRFPVEW